QSRTTNADRDLHEPHVVTRRIDTPAVPAPVPRGREHSRDPTRRAPAKRRDRGAIQREGAGRDAKPSADSYVSPGGAVKGVVAPVKGVPYESAAEECAKRILSELTRRAYRRPVTDADVAP